MTAAIIHISPILKSRLSRTLKSDRVIITKTPTVEIRRPSNWKVLVFSNLNKNHKITLILVTHEQEIASYGKRIIKMLDGSISSEEII